jgi:hypothetical protein
MEGIMSKTVLEFVDSLTRMPRLGEQPRLSREALRVLLDDVEISVHSLKVRTVGIDPESGRVAIEFAFCDEHDNVVINIGRHVMGMNDVLTVASVTNCLRFQINA